MAFGRTFGISTALVIIGVYVAVNMLDDSLPAESVTGAGSRALTPLAERVGLLRSALSLVRSGTDVVIQNERLRAVEADAAGMRATIEALQNENEFLRSSAAVPQRTEAEPVLAGIFVHQRAGGVHEAIINRGSRHWISRGDIVLDAGNGLVGIVTDVGDSTARVREITDPAFEVAARISGTTIAGLANAHAGEGLVLDLVKKDEQVSEGQEVVTSGADGLPAGIRLGVVRSVQDDAATLFRIVRLTPIVPASYTGPVLVVRP
jgi:rod shape-determining protein MreC